MPRSLLAMLAAIAAWILLLAGGELGLRLFGFRFNLPVFETLSERRVLEPAGEGAVRISPELLQRRGFLFSYMLPHPGGEISLRKRPGTFRVVLLADSSGHRLGQAPELQECLGRKSGRPVELVNLSFAGCGSERTRATAAEALGLEPDLLIVSTGHSDFVSLCRPATFTTGDEARYSDGFRRAFESVRLLQLAAKLGGRWMESTTRKDELAGETRPLQHAYSPAEKAQVQALLGENIEAIAAAAEAKGIPAVFLTMVKNYRRPPLWEGGRPDQLAPYQKLGEKELAAKEAAAPDPLTAYLAGAKAWERGRVEEARRLFEAAHERSARSFVATASANAAIREAAKRHGATLVDAQALIDQASANGLAGNELMEDHCHLNPEGTRLVAKEICALSPSPLR